MLYKWIFHRPIVQNVVHDQDVYTKCSIERSLTIIESKMLFRIYENKTKLNAIQLKRLS